MPRSLAVCLALACVNGFAGSRSAQQVELISNVTLSSATVPRFGRLELTFDVHASAANPFDPGELAVMACVRTPSGRQVSVPAFHYQGFTRRAEGAGEKLAPQGRAVWKARYAPRERGRHAVHVEAQSGAARCESAQLVFQCVGGPSRGFARRAGNGLAFEFDDGTPFFPIGMNLCWGRSTYDYDRWLDKLAAHGCNWARLWIGPWDLFTLEAPNGLGRCDLANAWRLDHVVEVAERKGIYLMFCLESFNSLRLSPDNAFWLKYPYNAMNGGPCELPEEFFTLEQARELFKRRLRYVAARWAYSTHVFAWEFWNEVDIIERYVSNDVRAWHKEMARSLLQLDPNRHLIGTSFANSDGDPAVDGLDELQFVQTHSYGAADIPAALNRYSLAKAARYGKPHFVGEFGLDAGAKGNEQDAEGLHLHEGLWAGAVSLAAGAPMIWWWDNYIEPYNLYPQYRPLAKFLHGVEWNERRWRPAQAGLSFTEPQPPRPVDVLVRGRHNAWEDHPSNAPQHVAVKADGTVLGAENLGANLHGLKHHPTWHNPVTFHVDGPQRWQLAVVVTGVSQHGGALLNVYLDGVLALRADFKEDPRQRNEMLKQYNGEYLVAVPAGRHTVQVANIGTDWIVCHFKLLGYAQKTTPDLRAFGMQDGTQALLWLQNETASHQARGRGVAPRTVEHVALTVGGLRNGAYAVEWWNTATGECRTEQTRAVDGALTVPVPPVATDIALKLRRL